MKGSGSLTTKVYVSDVSPLLDDGVFEAVYGSVSKVRKAKTDKLRFRKDKCLSLGAEYLLMKACGDFGINYRRARFGITAENKPCIRNSGLCFNLSHSENRVMCIVSPFHVGCDVEHVHPVDLDIAKRFFHENEYAMLEACTDDTEREQLFFRLWTLKESFIKCTGLGFRLPFSNFSVSFPDGKIMLEQSVDEHVYSMFGCSPVPGYHYAWCIRSEDAAFSGPEEVVIAK